MKSIFAPLIIPLFLSPLFLSCTSNACQDFCEEIADFCAGCLEADEAQLAALELQVEACKEIEQYKHPSEIQISRCKDGIDDLKGGEIWTCTDCDDLEFGGE